MVPVQLKYSILSIYSVVLCRTILKVRLSSILEVENETIESFLMDILVYSGVDLRHSMNYSLIQSI